MSDGNGDSFSFANVGAAMALAQSLLRHMIYTERMAIAFAAVCTVCVGLRIYVKLRMTKSFKHDDSAMIVAYVLFIVMLSLIIRFEHLAEKFIRGNFSVLPEGARIGLTGQVIYLIDTLACKLSVGLFLLPLFGLHGRVRRIIIHVLFIVSFVVGVTFVIVVIIIGTASDDAYFYDHRATGIRSAVVPLNLSWNIINMSTDVIYAVLCVAVIWESQFMPIRTKLVASILLCFGSVGAIASVLQLAVYLGWGWTNTSEGRLLLARYSIMECGLYIAAASLATTRPLFEKWLGVIKKLCTSKMTRSSSSLSASHPATRMTIGPSLRVHYTFEEKPGVCSSPKASDVMQPMAAVVTMDRSEAQERASDDDEWPLKSSRMIGTEEREVGVVDPPQSDDRTQSRGPTEVEDSRRSSFLPERWWRFGNRTRTAPAPRNTRDRSPDSYV